jgi:exodeoxyribonuclease VII large subunit
MDENQPLIDRHPYTVSELNSVIKGMLEMQFADVWVEGEISNFRIPASGHQYFTLKDNASQLRAVCFKSQNRLFKFKPGDGLAVLARGRITVYEPRGEYQLVIDYMEPMGLGSLQLAFEQLKGRLQKEGLFAAEHKRSLPLLPNKIGIVTSPTGAAIRDILRILKRRNRALHVVIYPVKVQGEGAAQEIAAGLRYFNKSPDIDVLIVGRGGGSIEDLWAFNEEVVARAIYASRIPVISAVGHEIDFTIADFVADLRAPTPSAAAEMVSAVRSELQERIADLQDRLGKAAAYFLQARRQKLEVLGRSRAFSSVENRIRAAQQRVDELGYRSAAALKSNLSQYRNRYQLLDRRLERANPMQVLRGKRSQLTLHATRLKHAMEALIEAGISRLSQHAGKLNALSPLAILARGYSICQDSSGIIITRAVQVSPKSAVVVRLSEGRLNCEVITTQL